MEIYEATEQAYKNGYEKAVKEFEEKKIIDSGYVVFNALRGYYHSPKGGGLYKTERTAQNQLEIASRLWGKSSLRVVKVKIVIDE